MPGKNDGWDGKNLISGFQRCGEHPYEGQKHKNGNAYEEGIHGKTANKMG